MLKKKIGEIISAELYTFRLLFSVSVPSGVLYIILRALFYPVSLINTLLWKYVIDELAVVYSLGNSTARLWLLLGIYLGINLLNGMISNYVISVLGNDIRNTAQNVLDLRVMQKIASLGNAFFDDPKNRDMLSTAQYSKDRVSGTITYIVSELLSIITFAAGLGLFISIEPAPAVGYLITCLPGMFINYRYDVQMNKHSINSIPDARKKDYYRSLLTEKYAAKDVRLYDLSGYFKEKYDALWKSIRGERAKIFNRGTKYSYFSLIFTMVGKSFLIVYTVVSILQGKMSLGTLSMFLTLSSQTAGQFTAIMRSIPNHFKNELPHINNFRNFLAYSDTAESFAAADGQSTAQIDHEDIPEIEFCDVVFRYPSASVNAIDHLNLKIPAGKKIALIGVNGAGKSTLVKLLLRFYEPESGRILINGIDIREYPLDRLYRLFGVCFQNSAQYSLTMRENIALSCLDEIHDDKKLHEAAQASGIYGKYSAFSEGVDSNLTRRFDDKGYELSGGEWQKVGIARAFFRNAPFIILDEPSSALDAQAEDELFSSFNILCRDKGGILISHRLSAMMMVDEIVLLQDGHVIEKGTHKQLMQKSGEYAKLYNMQAESYVSKEVK